MIQTRRQKGRPKNTALLSRDTSDKKPAKEAKNESNHNDIKMIPLLSGKYGNSWESILSYTTKAQAEAAKFIGPSSTKDILSIQEMAFQALMAVAPEENNFVVLGQVPYPRVEKASGIVVFDTLVKDWDCSQFGKTTLIHCIAKAAAIVKGIINQDVQVKTRRRDFKEKEVVSPPEWF
eukprot:9022641-Ditylum_brightwellii.AAC.1